MTVFNVLIFLFFFSMFVCISFLLLLILCWLIFDLSQDCLGKGTLIKTKITPYNWPVGSPVEHLMGDWSGRTQFTVGGALPGLVVLGAVTGRLNKPWEQNSKWCSSCLLLQFLPRVPALPALHVGLGPASRRSYHSKRNPDQATYLKIFVYAHRLFVGA